MFNARTPRQRFEHTVCNIRISGHINTCTQLCQTTNVS